MKFKKTIEALSVIALVLCLYTFTYVKMNLDYDFVETSYTVTTGDCLWDIARDYCPKGMNMHDYIDLVKERNELSSAIIYPGQNLIVFVERGA